MTRRREPRKAPQQRALIASTAARLIAEDGSKGYAAAKRKAVRMLGLPDSVELPDDNAIESELRTRLRLFQDGEQQERLQHLRTIAAEIMSITPSELSIPNRFASAPDRLERAAAPRVAICVPISSLTC